LHVIGHSHIDAAWLWPWRDGENEVLNTFRSVLDRMNETPDFRFSHSSSAHYRWVERTDPSMLDEIRGRVQEGRWEVVGGWPVEPDCNIPSTESFARHCLYGKNYIERTFGINVDIGFNPDSFGHAAGLPTILAGAGYRYYVFQRPGDTEKSLPHLFWWEGPDRSRVLTNRIWRGYDRDVEDIPRMVDGAFVGGFDHATFFMGVGDHGGGVTKEQISNLLRLSAEPNMPELRFSTLREFFQAVEASPAMSKLPVVRDELQHHARGCYSAYGEGKYQNRRVERKLVQTETSAVVAGMALDRGYPSDALTESWWKVLFCQFHDMMAGTAQYSDYVDVRDSLGFAAEVATTHTVEALEAMARRVDTRLVKEGAVFLFNPLPWRRTALVEYHTDENPTGKASITHLATQSGDKIPLQWRPPDNMSALLRRLSAWVELPPCGYQVLVLGHGEAAKPRPYRESATISTEGFGIASLRAEDGTELLGATIGLVVIGDTSDTWAHGISKFRSELGRPQLVSATVVEDGPVTRVTRHSARWQNSDIVVDIAEFAGIDIVELRFVIDWREHEQILKLEIPTALRAPQVYAKVPGAIHERQPNGEEEPYQDWVALSGKLNETEYTLSLINNSTYSYDCLDGLLRTVLIRSAPFARHIPAQVPHNDINAWQDQGRQERRFWLVGRRGGVGELNLDRLASELQTPAEYIADSAHPGDAPWQRSFFEVQPPSVEVLAIKRAERGAGTVVRLQERAGRKTQSCISSEAYGLRHLVSLQPWEMRTLLITTDTQGSITVCNVSGLETELPSLSAPTSAGGIGK
jgi:alpha-mannosidase